MQKQTRCCYVAAVTTGTVEGCKFAQHQHSHKCKQMHAWLEFCSASVPPYMQRMSIPWTPVAGPRARCWLLCSFPLGNATLLSPYVLMQSDAVPCGAFTDLAIHDLLLYTQCLCSARLERLPTYVCSSSYASKNDVRTRLPDLELRCALLPAPAASAARTCARALCCPGACMQM